MSRYTIKDFTQLDLIKVSSSVGHYLKQAANGFKWATLLALITASVVDFLIAASLCFTLARLRTGFEKLVCFAGKLLIAESHCTRTDSILKSLMLYVINTGVLTR
jgi:hypothetical protein